MVVVQRRPRQRRLRLLLVRRRWPSRKEEEAEIMIFSEDEPWRRNGENKERERGARADLERDMMLICLYNTSLRTPRAHLIVIAPLA